MPSLEALGEFRSSFQNLGDELRIRRELDLPSDDLTLPLHESAPNGSQAVPPAVDLMESEAGAEAEPANDVINFGDLSDLLNTMDEEDASFQAPDDSTGDPWESGALDSSSPGDVEFSNFIDSIPDDFENAETEGVESAGAETDLEASGFEEPELSEPELTEPELSENDQSEPEEDTGLPPGLLNGFADEIESERASPHDSSFEDINFDDSNFTDMSSDDLGSGDTEDLDFGADFGDLGLDEAGVGEEGTDADLIGDLDSLNPESLPFPDTGETVDLLTEEPAAGIGEENGGTLTDLANDEDFGSLGLDDFPDFDNSAGLDLSEPGSAEPGSAESGAEFDSSELDSGAIEDFPDFDTGASLDLSELNTAEIDSAEMDSADFDSPDLDSAAVEDFSEADSAAIDDTSVNEDFPQGDDDGFDLGGELSDFDNGATLEEIPGDSFDNFKLDANEISENFNIGSGETEGLHDGLGELEDFSLAGIDSLFDGASAPARRGTQRPGRAGRERAAIEGADEVEEIRLTDEEFERFQDTLSSYPLNLRIACEECIAEQAVVPDLMSKLVKLLVNGASARETAALTGQILGRTIAIPKGFEKKTGEALEAEQASFAYIFIHNFLPVLRMFLIGALLLLSIGYLGWKFIYTPLRAEKIYKLGYERIASGEYGRANDRFDEAFRIHEKKIWFYRYARGFREARQYTLAEEKYKQLLYYTASKNKRQIPEKAAVLEYADMETNTIGNYQLADEILRHNLLDFYPFDREALLALGDNSLIWGEYEKERLEDAREYYATYMERYGRSDPLLERMLKYFIRTDDLGEVLSLKSYFMASANRKITAPTLAELGGYLLDKRYEKIRGVPNEYLDEIGGIRDILLRAVQSDPMYPETYYHLARYYGYYENANDERLTLDLAVKVFDNVKEESPKRIRYHILTLNRYAEVLIGSKEFFPAEENLLKAINIYQDGLGRRLLKSAPEFGKLYTNLGDLEYFIKDGDMQSALDYYLLGEQNGWAPPEIQYRIGAAHYQLRQWGPAQDRLSEASRELPPNRRILYALGNVSYMRGDYFAAQGYYDRLLEILEADRSRLPPILPSDDEKSLDLAERLMVVQNNLGVTLEALTERTGNNRYRARAQGLYADSQRAWDILTRNPSSMLRMRPSPDIAAPGVNPAFLNVQNSLRPVPGYDPQFFLRIDKDVSESSEWEDLAPPGYRLSEGIHTGR